MEIINQNFQVKSQKNKILTDIKLRKIGKSLKYIIMINLIIIVVDIVNPKLT